MKTKLAITLLIAAILTLPAAGCWELSAKPKYRKGFLYREGRQLMLDGKPYRCVSFNSFHLCGCGHDYQRFTEEQTEALFASLPANTIVRTWATPAFNHRTGSLIKLAEKHDIKLILSLGDGRSSCGHFDGAPDGDNSGKTQEWYESGFRREYLPHVIEMATRYKDSPAIAMWEIINEPGEADWAAIRDFLHEVAAVIKRHDPNHLVESGTFAGWAYNGYENYRAMHDSPHIDVGNLHEYDYNYQQSNTIESPHFEPCLKAMYDLDKPLIVGETGIEGGDGCRTSRTRRAEAMHEKFDVYIGMGASVVLVWNLAREDRSCGFTFGLDDPMLEMIVAYQRGICGRQKGKGTDK